MDRRRFEFRYEANDDPLPRFASDTPVKIEQRVDIYILRRSRPDLLPKLRARERMQVKRLLSHAGALHYWAMPFDALLEDGIYVPERLLPGLSHATGPGPLITAAADHPDYHGVEVAKRRKLYQLGAVRAEITVAQAGKRRFRTVGFEADRPAELQELLAKFQIGDRANRHYGDLLA